MKNSRSRHWLTVGAIFFALVAIWGATYYSYSLFVTPIQDTLGVSRAQMVLGVTLKGIGSIIGSFLCSYFLSIVPVIKLVRLTSLLIVANIISLSFVQNLLQYYIVIFLQATLCSIGGYIPLSMIIHNWFKKDSSLAIGIALTGSSFGGVVFNWLGGIWIPALGWRKTMFLYGIITLVNSLITLFLIVKPSPAAVGLEPYGADKLPAQENSEKELAGVEVGAAFRSLRFWLLMIAIFLLSLAVDSVFTNLSPHLIDAGYLLPQAAKISSALMIVLMVGKPITGYLFDLLGLKTTSVVCILGLALGLISAIMINNVIFIVTLILGAGIGLAYSSVAFPIFSQELFGPKNYARFLSYMQISYGVSSIIAPVILSFIYRRTQSFVPAFRIFLALTLLVALIFFLILPAREKSRSK
ncbi:MAG TPA: MFS transporter [Clostridiaceae bacterium]|nr:MFS transporter [Clostridiaceae bacterium]